MTKETKRQRATARKLTSTQNKHPHHKRKHEPFSLHLDDIIPFDVILCNGHKFYQTEMGSLMTFREVLTQSGYDFGKPGRVIIIAEDPLRGKVYDYGNYDDEDEVREIGQTIGYA